MSKRILSVSYDQNLLTTRGLLLQREGYVICSAFGFTEAMARCGGGSFDLFIIGHSIPHTDKEELIKAFRSKSKAPVLSLNRPGEKTVDHAEYHAFPDDPLEFINMVERILKNGD